MDKNELLKVLDMPEDEQYKWICDNYLTWGFGGWRYNQDLVNSPADLAFRLRDEVDLEQWPQLAQAYDIVRHRWCKTSWAERHKQGFNKKHISSSLFWLFHSQPIHWIIAALIAKEVK